LPTSSHFLTKFPCTHDTLFRLYRLTFPDDLTPLMMQAYTKIHASRRHTARCHCTSPMLPMFVSSVAPRTTYLHKQLSLYNAQTLP